MVCFAWSLRLSYQWFRHILAKHNVYPIAYNTGENARRKHMGESSFPKPNAAEGEFMSNAAIGCLSFGARSERPTRPTAAEHSFGRVLLNGLHKLSETICVRGA